jgi:glucose/arabinose dehydrogenase
MTKRWLMLAAMIVVLTSGRPAQAPAGDPPATFEDEAVTNAPRPTSLAFLPDGRMLVTSQGGQLHLYDGTLNTILDLEDIICSNSERGLLGVTPDPQFATNRSIYLYYTFRKHGGCEQNSDQSPVNRVARFVLPPTNQIDRASQTVLIDNIPSPNGNHNGGDVKFGRDGFLYVSVGDGGCRYDDATKCAGANDAAREDHTVLGKILRITKDGGVPADNPFLGAGSVRCNQIGVAQPGQRCQETWAKGLRNPYRIGVDHAPGSSRIYINDVGQAAWEEVDVGIPGADYGWNEREGKCTNGSTTECGPPPAGLTDPLVAYSHQATGCRSITGGAFAPWGWPAPYHRAYFFGDFICGKIFRIVTDAQGTPSIQEFATDVGRVVALEVGPGADGRQALYYTKYIVDDEGDRSEVRRIIYNGPPPKYVRLPAVFK